MPYTLVIAEKPSVARDIARVLGAKTRADGFYEGAGVRVSWAIGHLVALAEPDEIDPRYKKWRAEELPILPEMIPLKVLPKTKGQYQLLGRLMADADCTDLICATDAGREGELIFRYVYRKAGCKKPFQRLWISSMTDEAIREGFARLRPGSAYDGLYESARCRSEADWLVGMNASRAFTLRYDALLSIGRVQTPTLALLVRRHQEIQAFASRSFWQVTAQFGGAGDADAPAYKGLWLDAETGERRLYDEGRARAIAEKVRGETGIIEQITREEKTEWPPYLYDLTSLQRDANRLFGFTAKKTLSIAQALYETHKLLTYPRTDSRHLPSAMAPKVRGAVEAVPKGLRHHAAPLLAKPQLPHVRRVFDDAKVTDHHAIIPTGRAANHDKLTADEAALYDLVCRRLLAAFYAPHRYEAVRAITRAAGEPFESRGRTVLAEGWKAVYADAQRRGGEKRAKKEDEATPLPALREGEAYPVRNAAVKADKTKPPAPHTDASLLAAMEHAGREIEDEALRESMRSSGLGTPATRAAILERLIAVGYARRAGRAIHATEKGVKLISVVPESIASPETTGRWEKALADIAQGGMQPDAFLNGIRRLAASLVKDAADASALVTFEKEARPAKAGRKAKGGVRAIARCPLCGRGDVLENSRAFYCSRWRDGCALKLWKDAATRSGGPALTAALVGQLLTEGTLRGSTGVLAYADGRVTFTPKPKG